MKRIIAALVVQLVLAATATPASPQGLIGAGFSPTDNPDSPYYLGEIAPPSWQGRPYAIPDDGALTSLLSRWAHDGRGAE
jgi:hypothetical protein